MKVISSREEWREPAGKGLKKLELEVSNNMMKTRGSKFPNEDGELEGSGVRKQVKF